MRTVKTSSKCQIVIPVAVRRRLGIVAGQHLEVKMLNDTQFALTPVPKDAAKRLHGSFADCRPSLAGELIEEHEKDGNSK